MQAAKFRDFFAVNLDRQFDDVHPQIIPQRAALRNSILPSRETTICVPWLDDGIGLEKLIRRHNPTSMDEQTGELKMHNRAMAKITGFKFRKLVAHA